MKKYRLLFLVGMVGIIGACGIASRSDAQTAPAQMILSWEAATYTPRGFTGKVLPTSDTVITVGVDIIDRGKRVDLSAFNVQWYLNNQFYQGAPGLSRITITAPHFIGRTSIMVKALVSDYGSGPGKAVTIPVVPPEVVIQSSAPGLSTAETPFSLQAYPYFFNVQDISQLVFEWSLNGSVAGNQNPFIVTREMANRNAATVELAVRNPNRPIERTSNKLIIFRPR